MFLNIKPAVHLTIKLQVGIVIQMEDLLVTNPAATRWQELNLSFHQKLKMTNFSVLFKTTVFPGIQALVF